MALAATIAALILPAPATETPATPHPDPAPPTDRADAVRPYRAKLNRMAWCESRQRWWINTGNGFYGGLQFDLQTWRGVGGQGMPHQNSKLEQMYRAVRLIRRRGYAPWPVCGYA